MTRLATELLQEWKAKQQRFDEAQEEYISVSSLPIRTPRKVLTEEALRELDQMGKEAAEAKRAWLRALEAEAQAAICMTDRAVDEAV